MTADTASASHRCSHATSGFTLLELLVSLALMASILALLPGALHITRRSWQSAAVLDVKSADLVVMSFLRERLSEAMPLLAKSSDGALRIAFRGDPHSVAFVAPVVDGPLGTGLFAFESGWRNDSTERPALMLTWRPYSAEGNAPAIERELLPNVTTFDLRYFGYRIASGQRGWADTWSELQSLPELVELSLADKRASLKPHVAVIQLPQRDVAR